MNHTQPDNDTINRDIAEWRGWKFIPSHDVQVGHVFRAVPEYWIDQSGEIANDIPSFTNSHDACAEALQNMSAEQLNEYDYALTKSWLGDPSSNRFQRRIHLATPAQKALAIWRVVKGENK